ncbi:hypothetical protein JCM10450v2_008311 [Rhodotorula kratochvilovae]
MSLLALPDELLLQILRHAAPRETGPLRWRARQDTLLACCLVSKRIHTVARPLLWEVVCMHLDAVPFTLVADRINGWTRFTRTLAVRAIDYCKDRYRDKDRQDLATLFELFPNVEELMLFGFGEGTDGGLLYLQDVVKAYPNLERLSIGESTIHLMRNRAVVFPAVQELALRFCDINRGEKDLLSKILTTETFPSLRTLYYSAAEVSAPPSAYPTIEPALLAQLDAFEVFGPGVLPAAYYATETPVLRILEAVPRSLVFRLHPQERHLFALWTPDNHFGTNLGYPAWFDEYDTLAAIIRSHSLQSVFLPSVLHPARPLGGTLGTGRAKIYTASLEKKVHVEWAAVVPLGYGVEDEFVLPEFWEYARRLKRGEEVETQWPPRLTFPPPMGEVEEQLARLGLTHEEAEELMASTAGTADEVEEQAEVELEEELVEQGEEQAESIQWQREGGCISS